MVDTGTGRWLEERHDGGIVVAGLNRPPANALTIDFLLEIAGHFDRLGQDRTTSALVLRGSDKVFCAGMDLKLLATLDEVARQAEVVDALNTAYRAMYGFPKPLVAAVSGHAIAGGLFFVLGADYRIAAAGGAQFGLSEVRVGVAFPVAPLEIARAELVAPVARRILLSGQPVGVDEALAGGIVDEIAEPAVLMAHAIAKARDLAASPPEAYAQVKQQLRAPVMDRIDRAIGRGDDPMRRGWFTPETTKAALEVLAGRR